ncbi:MAG: hypothetical protein U0169_18040 [Polyangiaceae bacterium]
MRRSLVVLAPIVGISLAFVACSSSSNSGGFDDEDAGGGTPDASVSDAAKSDGGQKPLDTPDAKSDAKVDSSTSRDTGADTSDGSDTADAGSDADAGRDSGITRDSGGGPPCTGDFAPCALPGKAGVCVQGECNACSDPTDDNLCTFAYGTSGDKYICNSGSCAVGCRTSAGCDPGQICGSFAPGKCGACTSDTQCKGDSRYGLDAICDQNTLTCVPGSCATPNAACTANAADICCTAPGASTNRCVQGECCSAAQCGAGERCRNNMCVPEACTAVDLTATNVVFHVDPKDGSDGNGTGIPSCKLKTISRALALIGPNPTSQVQIVVYDTAIVSAGESFPLVLPQNVSLESSAQYGVAQFPIKVPLNQLGIWMKGDNSRIKKLRISGDNGGNSRASIGVAVTGGSPTPGTPSIDNVDISKFDEAGLVVTGGTATVDGLNIDHSHQPTNSSGTTSGLRIAGGTVEVTPVPDMYGYGGGQTLTVRCYGSQSSTPVSCVKLTRGTLKLTAPTGTNTYATTGLTVTGGSIGFDQQGGNVSVDSKMAISITQSSAENWLVNGGTVDIRGGLQVAGGTNGMRIKGGNVSVIPESNQVDTVNIGTYVYGGNATLSEYGVRVENPDSLVTFTGQAGQYSFSNINIQSGNLAAFYVDHRVQASAPTPKLVSLTRLNIGGYSNGYYEQNRTGDGLLVNSGSNVRLRDSAIRLSTLSAVHVVTPNVAGLSKSLRNIDLGSDTQTNRGGNVLQARNPGGTTASNTETGPNLGAGICLEIAADKGETLNAIGNFFTDPTFTRQFDCSAVGAMNEVVLQRASCTGTSGNFKSGVAGPGLRDNDGNATNNNTIAVTRCRISSDIPDGG